MDSNVLYHLIPADIGNPDYNPRHLYPYSFSSREKVKVRRGIFFQ